MAINITVLKYGDKYSPNYVHNFFKHFKEYSTVPCKFWVQTENPAGLDPEIGILPIEKVDQVGRRWHKIDLFETDLLKGDCFHFDLDMIFQKNIDHYLKYKSDKLTVLYANYKTPEQVAYMNVTYKGHPTINDRDGMYNSSIFYWNTESELPKNVARRHYEIEDIYAGSFCRFVYWEGKKNVGVFPFRDYNNVLINGVSATATINLYNQMFDVVRQKYDPLL